MLLWGGGDGGNGVSVSTLDTFSEGGATGSSLGNWVSSEEPSSGLYVNWSCSKWPHHN